MTLSFYYALIIKFKKTIGFEKSPQMAIFSLKRDPIIGASTPTRKILKA